MHRDLKPGNLLVGREGVAKVIDFGLARAQDSGQLGVSVVETQAGSVIGTLPYMSPEHLDGRPMKIDVRSDVYSMGCVLWELLTGRTPHAVQGLPVAAAVRLIEQESPTPPKELPSDLRWILLKATDQDPQRRYVSAGDFAADLARFRAKEPVLAVPPSAWYRTRRWVRKHGAFLTAVGAVVLALGIGLWQAKQEARRSELARQEAIYQGELAGSFNSFLQTVFDSLSIHRHGVEAKVVDVLEDQARVVERIEDPRVKALAQGFLGRGYLKLGDWAKAQVPLEAAYQAVQEHFEPNSQERLDIEELWSDLLIEQERYEEAIELCHRILPLMRTEFGTHHRRTVDVRTTLASSFIYLGRFAEAEAVYLETIELVRNSELATTGYLFSQLTDVSYVQSQLGKREAALASSNEAIALFEARSKQSPASEFDLRMSTGLVGLNLGDYPMAAREFERGRELAQDRPGWQQRRYTAALNLSSAYLGLGRYAEAREQLDDAESFADSYGESPTLTHCLVAVGRVDVALQDGQVEEAAERFAQCESLTQQAFGDRNLLEAEVETLRGRLQIEQGAVEDGVRILKSLQQKQLEAHGMTSRSTQKITASWIRGMHRLGRFEETRALAEAIVQHVHPEDPEAAGYAELLRAVQASGH